LSTPSVKYGLPICVTDEIDQILGKTHKKTLCKNRGLFMVAGGDAGN
jgi:hypothetical protein